MRLAPKIVVIQHVFTQMKPRFVREFFRYAIRSFINRNLCFSKLRNALLEHNTFKSKKTPHNAWAALKRPVEIRNMALSDFYQSTIISVAAYFGFSDFSCHPDEITKALGVEPDGVLVKGAKRSLRNGRVMENLFNSWSICSRDTSKDVNVHIRELLQRIAGKEAAFRKDFGTPSVSILWKGNYLYAGSGPFYEADVIKGIATLGAELGQDIYQIDQSDDEIEYKGQFRRIPK